MRYDQVVTKRFLRAFLIQRLALISEEIEIGSADGLDVYSNKLEIVEGEDGSFLIQHFAWDINR